LVFGASTGRNKIIIYNNNNITLMFRIIVVGRVYGSDTCLREDSDLGGR